MAQPVPNEPHRPTLNYQQPPRANPWKVVFLIFSIFLALGVAAISALAVLFMLDDHKPDFAIILIACPVGLAIYAFVTRRRGRSAALAMTVISVITFLLMLGLCTQVQVHL